MLPNNEKISEDIEVLIDLTDPSAMPKFALPLCSLPGARKSPLLIIETVVLGATPIMPVLNKVASPPIAQPS